MCMNWLKMLDSMAVRRDGRLWVQNYQDYKNVYFIWDVFEIKKLHNMLILNTYNHFKYILWLIPKSMKSINS